MSESPLDPWPDPPRRRGGRSGRGWDAIPRRGGPRTGDRTSARPSDRARGRPGGVESRDPGEAARAWADAARDPADAARDPAEVARDICLGQLAVRPRTRQELAATLHRRGVAPDVAAEVLDRYGEVGMIDDRAFASAWVSSRHHSKGLARRALAGELRRKGVDGEFIDGALDELDREVEVDTARELVRRRLRGHRPTPRPAPPGAAGFRPARPPERADALFRRLVGMLARKGYPPGLAVSVVREAMAELAAEAGELDEIADSLDIEATSGDADPADTEVWSTE
jgi:regulatory protein